MGKRVEGASGHGWARTYLLDARFFSGRLYDASESKALQMAESKIVAVDVGL